MKMIVTKLSYLILLLKLNQIVGFKLSHTYTRNNHGSLIERSTPKNVDIKNSERSLRYVELLLSSLNNQVKNILSFNDVHHASNYNVDHPEINADEQRAFLQYRSPFLDERERNFSHVLSELDHLEDDIQKGLLILAESDEEQDHLIRILMKPMLGHIHSIRENLIQVQKRYVSIATLTNVTNQVDTITNELDKVFDQTMVKSKKKIIRVKPIRTNPLGQLS